MVFISKRGRQDIQPAMAALCTRVKKPTETDWNKLVRFMRWLFKTRKDVMTFDARLGLALFEWFIDASFAVHPDFRSHTGGSGRFEGGLGCPINVSSKQKLNTDSSAAAELVAVGQLLPLVMWIPLFLQEQGYPVKTRVYQDNKSAILLEKNGRALDLEMVASRGIRNVLVEEEGRFLFLVSQHRKETQLPRPCLACQLPS